MDGYKFLMQNYCAGDKICIFGASYRTFIIFGVNIGIQVSLVALILPGGHLVEFLSNDVHAALQGLGGTLVQGWTLAQRQRGTSLFCVQNVQTHRRGRGQVMCRIQANLLPKCFHRIHGRLVNFIPVYMLS